VHRPDPQLASRILWFDGYVSNVDRTARNTNMLLWHRRLWLIDHGATLYFHHMPGWATAASRARESFALIRNHVLLPFASALPAIDDAVASALSGSTIAAIVAAIPDGWLREAAESGPPAVRAAYAGYLVDRLAAPRAFVEEAARVR
jgi:hypothetical protein